MVVTNPLNCSSCAESDHQIVSIWRRCTTPHNSTMPTESASPVQVPPAVHQNVFSHNNANTRYDDHFELPITEVPFEQLRLEREALANSRRAMRAWRMSPYAPPGIGLSPRPRKYRYGLPWYGWALLLSGLGCLLCMAMWELNKVGFNNGRHSR